MGGGVDARRVPDVVAIVAAALGLALVLAALLDVLLAILHLDVPAPLAKGVQRSIWRVTLALARGSSRHARFLVAAAGPVMVVATLVVWAGLPLLGFSILVWPHLDTAFTAAAHPGPPTFVDAVYYSGVTLTTLGYGDVTPVAPAFRLLALVQAAIGFFVVASVVAYLLNVLDGVTERNTLAIRVQAETGQTGDGVQLVLRSLRYEDPEDLRARFENLARDLQGLQEKFHAFPILAFYYHSADPAHDPEPMLQAVADAAIAGYLASATPGRERLRPAVENLDSAARHFMEVIAAQYMSRRVLGRLLTPRATDADADRMAAVRARLEHACGETCALPSEDEVRHVLLLAARARVFLDALDRLTGWRTWSAPRRASG